MSVELKITVPRRIYELLLECEKKKRIRKEDLLVMSIIRLIEELEVK